MTARALSTLAAAEGSPAVLQFYREMRAREDRARETARTGAAAFPAETKWAKTSPDGRYAVIGLEDPRSWPTRTALLVEIGKTATVRDVSVSGWGDSVADTQWSSHSRHLAVLQSRERWSKAPLAFLLAVLGHPTPLKSFSVRIVDVRTRNEVSVPIVVDVRFGEGLFAK